MSNSQLQEGTTYHDGRPKSEPVNPLAAMFAMQAELNDLVFRKANIMLPQGMPSGSVVPVLRMKDIIQAAWDGKFGPNDLPNTWLRNYSTAMRDELGELDRELLWKWWSKDKIDMQNIRVELIDQLFFLISMFMAAGMTWGDVQRMYRDKYEVNINRQVKGYSKATKDESDNKGIVMQSETDRLLKVQHPGLIPPVELSIDPALPDADQSVKHLIDVAQSLEARLFKINQYLKGANLVTPLNASDEKKDEFFRPDELVWPDGPFEPHPTAWKQTMKDDTNNT